MNMQSNRTRYAPLIVAQSPFWDEYGVPQIGRSRTRKNHARKYFKRAIAVALTGATLWLIGPIGIAIVAGIGVVLLAGALWVCAYALDNSGF